jgi:MFS family permease
VRPRGVLAGGLAELSRDGRILLVTSGLRSLAFGFLSVILGPYLAARGLSAAAVGAVFTAALVGGAAMTILVTWVADRVGRRRMLIASAMLMALGALPFALGNDPVWLLLGALVGSISPSGKEVGPFLSIEQAILPATISDAHRTSAFAAYNLIGSLCGALGALLVALPGATALPPLLGYRLLMWGYVAVALVLAASFAALSPRAEAPRLDRRATRFGISRSRAIAIRLAGLFALDAFAGGFVVQGMVSYWFHLRYGMDDAGLAGLFFGANLLSALSFLAAAPLARRLGLLNTMVFTHLPSNVLLLMVPLMPTLGLAAGVLLARHLLSQLDVPTRQSYTMAIVAPEERAAVAGLTSVARNAAAAVAPAFAGLTLAVPALGVPFLVAGGLKIAYDVLLLVLFRFVRPPEEGARAPHHSEREVV